VVPNGLNNSEEGSGSKKSGRPTIIKIPIPSPSPAYQLSSPSSLTDRGQSGLAAASRIAHSHLLTTSFSTETEGEEEVKERERRDSSSQSAASTPTTVSLFEEEEFATVSALQPANNPLHSHSARVGGGGGGERGGNGAGNVGADFLVAVDVAAAVAHGHFAKLRWIDNMNAK